MKELPSTQRSFAMRSTLSSVTLIGAACGTLLAAAAWSQQTLSVPADAATSAPAVNHESGTIEEVLTVEDKGFRMRGYIVHWRDSRIFVAGSAEEPRHAGDTVDFRVYRNPNGHGALRFSTSQTDPDANVAADESKNARVAVTAGTSKVDDVLLADNDGYHFKAYAVMWHDTRIVVVDPLLHATHAVSDQITFKVLHTGANDNQQLAFALDE